MRYLNAPNTAFGEDRRSYKTGTNGVTSNQTVFNVSYDNGRVEAYLNGVRLYPGDDYTKSSSGIGTSITLASAIGANNVLEVVGYQGINSGNALVEDNFVVGTNSTGSGGSYGGSTTVFNVASSAGDTVSVWRNGVKLVPTTDYTVQVSANTVTIPTNQAAVAGDEITIQVVGLIVHANFYDKTYIDNTFNSLSSSKLELSNTVALDAETITYQKLLLGNTFTLGGNLTVNGNLVLGKIIADSTGQTLSGSGYTITGTGQITMNATLV